MQIVFIIIIISCFGNLRRHCSDSWKQHSKQIHSKYLRVINIETARKMNLKPAQKLCRHSYERVANNVSLNTEDMPEDLDASFYHYTFERNESSFNAETIGISLIKKVSSRDKIEYGRNKLKRIKVDIDEKVAEALDISAEELQPETRVDCSKCNDVDKSVVLIKEKLFVSSQNEKLNC